LNNLTIYAILSRHTISLNNNKYNKSNIQSIIGLEGQNDNSIIFFLPCLKSILKQFGILNKNWNIKYYFKLK